MHIIHVATVAVTQNDPDHQMAINAKLRELPEDALATVTMQHSVTAIDARGDYQRGIGSGWLFSTIILITC